VKVVAIIQARLGSTRLPGKMLMLLLDRPVIAWTVQRVRLAEQVDEVVVATSRADGDDRLAAWCRDNAVPVFRGSEEDVLDRYYRCAREYGATHVVRVTGDCPLCDPRIVDDLVTLCLADDELEYVTNCEPLTYPEGMGVEVLPVDTLEKAWRESTLPSHREHVTPYIRFHPERFRHTAVTSEEDLSHIRLTVDYPEDLMALERLTRLLDERHLVPDFRLSDVVALLDGRPDIQKALSSRERDLWRLEVARDERRPLE